MNLLLALPLLLPLAAAALCVVLRAHPRLQAAIAISSASSVLLVGLGMLWVLGGGGVAISRMGGWPVPAGIALVADGLSAALVAVSGLIVLSAALYRSISLREASERGIFHPLLMALLAGVCGAFLTGDLFNLFVWFEVILISSFALLALEGRAVQVRAAVTYVLLNVLASATFLAGLGVLYGKVGNLAMAEVGRIYELALANGEAGTMDLALALLLVAFSIKAGAFPLYAWLPASYHTPAYAVSAVFAGLLTKVGVYALIRLTTVIAPGATWITDLLLVVGVVTMLLGVLGAACQIEIRRILSYHIISQIGYLIAGLAIGGAVALAAVVFYLIHHIVVKANLFFVGGLVARHGGEDLRSHGGLAAAWPLLGLAFLIPALSLAGLPPLSGFAAKLGIIDAAVQAEQFWVAAAALATGLLTLFSMLKIWVAAFWGERPQARPARLRAQGLRVAPMLGLATATVALGLAAGPILVWCGEVALVLTDPTAYRLPPVERQP